MTETALNVVSFLFLGFFLGMRHATDADHVVAIATIVSREHSIVGSAVIGAAWGVGHTVTVMAVGAAIIVFGVVIPPVCTENLNPTIVVVKSAQNGA
jgi:high-affinity nickel-transport protein